MTDRELEPSLGDQARVSGWLPSAPGLREELSPTLQRFIHGLPESPPSPLAEAGSWSLSQEQDPGWQDAWRAWFKPLRVGKRILIRPPWTELGPPRPDEVVVTIEPGMAFGTGGHATTRLCLEALEAQTLPPPKTMLDVGTGSGVLAIAAALMGVAQVVALDNDPIALEAAQANANANQVSERIHFDSRWPEAAVELVVANIVSPVLLSLCQRLCGRVAPGGRLVLSGILSTEEEQLKQRFEAAGLLLISRLRLEADADWIALVFQRPAP